MMDMLLSSGYKPIFIANSGPGPKIIVAGDANLGYFGEVTDAQLFTPTQIGNAAGFYTGTDNPSAATSNIWLKFIWNGTVLFIAKMPFRSNVSWSDLYSCGLIYGTRDNGKFPLATPKYQYVQLPKYEGSRLWVLKPRVPTGYNSDPVVASTAVTGEWSQLLGRCSVDANTGVGGAKFASFSYAAMGIGPTNGPDSVVMETIGTNTANSIVRGDINANPVWNAFRSVTKVDRGTGVLSGWRPVLELIPDKAAKDPYAISIVSIGPYPTIISNLVPYPVFAIAPSRPNSKQWPYKTIPVSYSFANYAIKPSAPKGNGESPSLKGFTISGSYVA